MSGLSSTLLGINIKNDLPPQHCISGSSSPLKMSYYIPQLETLTSIRIQLDESFVGRSKSLALQSTLPDQIFSSSSPALNFWLSTISIKYKQTHINLILLGGRILGDWNRLQASYDFSGHFKYRTVIFIAFRQSLLPVFLNCRALQFKTNWQYSGPPTHVTGHCTCQILYYLLNACSIVPVSYTHLTLPTIE